MSLLAALGNFTSALWFAFVHAFKAAPTTWLILVYALVSTVVMLSGKRIKPRVMFVMSGLSFAIAAWTFSEAKQSSNHDATYSGGVWLALFLIWLFAGIRDHNKAKKAAAGGKK